MLSLHTKSAALNATNAFLHASQAQSVAATRLSTGYRVNSAADDAAGLQIATRLKAQAAGTQVAMRNIQNGISLIQTADGIAEGLVNTFMRMNVLAVQAADGGTSIADREALHTEYKTLESYAWEQLVYRYNGEMLFIGQSGSERGKFSDPVKLQIGAGSSEVLEFDFASAMSGTNVALSFATSTPPKSLVDKASEAIDITEKAINAWAGVRSALGAIGNRLEHSHNNAANLLTNTESARGRIMDTDYATEAAQQATQQMLMQSSTSMLKQTQSLAQMAIALISS